MKVNGRSVVVGGQAVASLRSLTRARLHANIGDVILPPPGMVVSDCHDFILGQLNRRCVPALRLALGLVFLWFGTLKLFGASPMVSLLEHAYWFLPVKSFAVALGVWEVLIGAGLTLKRTLRFALCLLFLHLTGTFLALAIAPALFFNGSFLRLTLEGEFVVKNMVLMGAALVICGHEVKPLGRRRTFD